MYDEIDIKHMVLQSQKGYKGLQISALNFTQLDTP